MRYWFLLLTVAYGIWHFVPNGSWAESEHRSDSVASSEFHIALRQNNIPLLASLVQTKSDPGSVNYGKWMSIEEIDKLVATDPERKAALREWLLERNVEILAEYADGFYCRADSSTLDDIFKIQRSFDCQPICIETIVGYTIPDQFRDIIVFIDGLEIQALLEFPSGQNPRSARILTPRYKLGSLALRNVSANVDPGIVTREVFQRLYNIEPGLVASNKTSAGAMEYLKNKGFTQESLEMCQEMNGLPKKPVAEDHIIGKNFGVNGESTLDMQMIAQIAGNVELWYEEYTGWMYGWAANFYNRKDVPQVVSISWGWSETEQCEVIQCNGTTTSKQYVERTNNEFLKLAARGITIVVASGDAGSPGRTNEDCIGQAVENMNPVFPGSSEWVTSVGATYILNGGQEFENSDPVRIFPEAKPYHTPICKLKACANGTVEQGVTYNETGWTSGAGFAHWTPTPHWQLASVRGYLGSGVELPEPWFYNQGGRAYPDVAAIGHNCEIYMGSWVPADGTSCAAPVFAAVIALLNDHQQLNDRPVIGYANPLLYKMYAERPSTFHDILVGDSRCTEVCCCSRNYGFIAAPGWDPVGGLGTPNVGEMKRYLDSLVY